MKNKAKMIIFSGGGTLGPVAPLLGVYEEMKRADPKLVFAWVGTKDGPERAVVESAGIRFIPIASGKLRRYFSWRNLSDLLWIKLGFFESLVLMLRHRPALVLSAGAYVSVPLVWAAWAARVPAMIHQQDAEPGLANRLMAPAASVITVTFEDSLSDYGNKALWAGNCVRPEFSAVKVAPREARQKFGLSQRPEVVLILGGGTGARAINDLAEASVPELSRFCQVLHITGQGKMSGASKQLMAENPNYRAFEFLDTFGMIKAYAAADIVVCRCGMSTLTEISFLAKAAILVPMPATHQEKNAQAFARADAAIVLDQEKTAPEAFIANIRELVQNDTWRRRLGANAADVIRADGQAVIARAALKLARKA